MLIFDIESSYADRLLFVALEKLFDVYDPDTDISIEHDELSKCFTDNEYNISLQITVYLLRLKTDIRKTPHDK